LNFIYADYDFYLVLFVFILDQYTYTITNIFCVLLLLLKIYGTFMNHINQLVLHT